MIRSDSPRGVISLFLNQLSPSDEASHSLDPILSNERGVGQCLNLVHDLITYDVIHVLIHKRGEVN